MHSKSDELVLNWLNDEIKLNPPVQNIINEFYNGYRFAEILYNIKEINEKQFQEFSNTSNYYNIKDNFLLLKKYFKEKLEYEIRLEEFFEIMNKDISKAVVTLYKLKNSISKKKIHFHKIRISLDDLTKEELEKKVKEIMDFEYMYKDLLYDYAEEEDDNYNSSNFQFTSNLKTIKPRKFYSNNISLQNILEDKIEEIEEKPDKSKLRFKFINNKIANNDSPKNIINKRNRSTLNDIEANKDINRTKLPNIYKSVDNSNQKQKNFFRPELNTHFSLRKKDLFLTGTNTINNFKDVKIKFGNGKNNIVEENKFRVSKLSDSLHKYGIKDFNSSFKNTMPVFNITNNIELDKVRKELKNRMNKKIFEPNKKLEKIRLKKDLRIRIFNIPEIDFLHRQKNPLYKTRLPIGISLQKHNRYLTAAKRLKYSKQWKIYSHQREIEKKIKNFSLIIKKIKKTNKKDDNNYFFDKDIYLSNLEIYSIETLNEIEIKKYLKKKKDYPIIKNIALLIIELTMEIFFYREENNEQLIDLETFNKLLELFIYNKPMRERVADADLRLIKERNKEKEEINPDKLILTEEEKNLRDDYKNFVGLFNDDKIMLKEFRGLEIDIKKLKTSLPEDYEPTENEIEDLIFPVYNPENYIYGDVILDLLDNKFMNKNKINISNEKGKWEHINYKIALIGYPFCGKKLIANELNKKYQNLKIYSVQKILRNYYDQYKEITEPIENYPKFKSLKPNQIEQIKKEKEDKLKEFEPILQLIQPYIDLINEKNNNENKNENLSNNDITIANDETLLKILIYNIEKDFPKLSNEEIKNEIEEYQNNLSNLKTQKESLQKQVTENKKHNPKEDQTLLNIEKEMENLKNNSIKGFILVDFPTNLNQCKLLENYLTGYIDETQRPKNQKMINIQNINSLFDFNFIPPESSKIKKSGIDFIINIISKEEDINERFNKRKYDPLNDKIYSEYELNQELVNNKDKKFVERLIDNIPYFTNEHFDYYKKEYNENISKIDNFYKEFGFEKDNLDNNFNILNIDDNDKEINKTYQEIKAEVENKKDIESLNSEKNDEKKSINNKIIPTTPSPEDEMKNKIINFITDKIIDVLFKIKDEKDKKIFYTEHPDLNVEEEKDKIQFDPEFKVNEIRGEQTLKKMNKEKNIFKNVIDNFDLVLPDLKLFNTKYNRHIGKFIHLLKRQKKNIYTRLNLIQKKYRDFLNQQSDKRDVIKIFCDHYNSFFNEYPKYFNSSSAINDFSHRIDELNDALWILIDIKENVSIRELQEIKNSNFIEFELKKFYKNIKDLFLLETEKFLFMINSIINLYKRKKDESTSSLINLIKKSNEKDEKNKNIYLYNKEYILKDLIKISEPHEIIEDDNDIENNDIKNDKKLSEYNPIFYKKKNEPNSIDYIINKNIEIIFNNSLNLILEQEERIENLLKFIKESMSMGFKKSLKFRKKANESIGSSLINTGLFQIKESGGSIEENIRKMFQNEKNKFKYRISFLRSFVYKYMIFIIQTSIKIFENIDNWITKSITLQNEAQNKVIHKLRSILNEKRLIDEEKDINIIELDSFEKENNQTTKRYSINTKKTNKNNINEKFDKIYRRLNIDYLLNDDFVDIEIKEDKDNIKDEENDSYKKFKIIISAEIRTKLDNIILSNVHNKLSYKFLENDFHYNIDKFQGLYNKIKKFEVKKNILSEDIFYEMFVKKYLFNKDIYDKETTKTEENKNQNINNNNNLNIVEENTDKQVNNDNIVNENINKNLNYIKNLPFICKPLRILSTKNIKKLISYFEIPINHKTEICSQNIQNENNNNEDEKNINDNNNEKSQTIIYDNYLNTAQLFTILSLIGCNILTDDIEKEIMLKLKIRLIDEAFLSKNDFERFNFWFEEDFGYLNIDDKKSKTKRSSVVENKNTLKKWERKKTRLLTKLSLNSQKSKKIEEKKFTSIKDFLYNVWKDDKGNFNFKEFINVLKVSKYKNNLEDINGIKYYDIVFGD